MNRILSAAIVALVLVFPAGAFASVISLSPTNVSVTPGKVFTVTVVAHPNGAHIYTVRANLAFNPALVTVTGFTFAPKWFVLPMTGYSVINNTTGVLIKTGGYPGGITATTVLGTATFKAKATGSVHISVTTKSLLYDANSKNTISGTQGSSSVVIVPVQAPKPEKKPATKHPVNVVHKKTAQKEVFAHSIAVKATVTKKASTVATTTATTTSGTTVLPLRASASAPATGNNTKFVVAILAIVALVIILWMNRKRLFTR